MEEINVDSLSRGLLQRLNENVAKKMNGDCVFINCAMFPPLDDEFRVVVEKIKHESTEEHLVVILETLGGDMETVERLVVVMRAHYERVSFVIPNFAYSAGTVLALSGDKIYMDYYSVLGPIDPQYPIDGKFLPGYGYLAKFKEITEKINKSKRLATCRAELVYLIKNFDPALLFSIEQSIEHGISLITEWLPKYKFKDWEQTEIKGKAVTVTEEMKQDRAKAIAEDLGDASKWHSHGRGITMKGLSDIKLQIDDFGSNVDLSDEIREYHGFVIDYFTKKRGEAGYIHSRIGIRKVR